MTANSKENIAKFGQYSAYLSTTARFTSFIYKRSHLLTLEKY